MQSDEQNLIYGIKDVKVEEDVVLEYCFDFDLNENFNQKLYECEIAINSCIVTEQDVKQEVIYDEDLNSDDQMIGKGSENEEPWYIKEEVVETEGIEDIINQSGTKNDALQEENMLFNTVKDENKSDSDIEQELFFIKEEEVETHNDTLQDEDVLFSTVKDEEFCDSDIEQELASTHIQYNCPFCDHISNGEIPLQRHYKYYHSELNQKNYEDNHPHSETSTCKMKKKTSITNESNTSHKKNILSELHQIQYPCSFCDHVSTREIGLKRHIERRHSKFNQKTRKETPPVNGITSSRDKKDKSKDHKCHLCEFATHRIDNLRNHIRHVHLNLRKYSCDLCDFTCQVKYSLYKHINECHKEEGKNDFNVFECKLCSYVAYKKSHFTRHLEGVHLKSSKSMKCDICDFSTTYNYYLKHHMDFVHNKKKKLKCEFCDYSTSWKHILRRHVDAIHKNEKPNVCHLCDFSSNRRDNLRLHINSVHLRVNRYKCQICGYSSSSKIDLRTHSKTHLK